MSQLQFDDLKFQNILHGFDLRFVDPCAGSDQLEPLNLTASANETQCLTDYGRFHHFASHFWLFQPDTVAHTVSGLKREKGDSKR